MVDRRLSGLPVVTSEGGLVGMLTASDLLHRVETGRHRFCGQRQRLCHGKEKAIGIVARQDHTNSAGPPNPHCGCSAWDNTSASDQNYIEASSADQIALHSPRSQQKPPPRDV